VSVKGENPAVVEV